MEVTWCSLRPRQTVEPHNGVHQEPQTRPRHGGKQTGQVSSEEINLPWWPQLLSNKSCPRCIYGLEVSKTEKKVKHKTNKYLYVIAQHSNTTSLPFSPPDTIVTSHSYQIHQFLLCSHLCLSFIPWCKVRIRKRA